MTDLKEKEKKLEERIKALPIAKVFPISNYKGLLESDLPAWRVALLHAIRDDLPRKPNWKRKTSFDAQYYIDIVREAVISREWLLSDKQASPELLEFCSKWREWKTAAEVEDIGEPMARKAGITIPADPGEPGRFVLGYLAGEASTVNLRAGLYEHYGHGVSFKPLRFAWILQNSGMRAREGVRARTGCVAASRGLRVLDRCGIVKGFGGGFDFFAQGELERLVNSPEIQKWYENKLEKSKEKSKEQGNEKEEGLDEDLEGGMSY